MNIRQEQERCRKRRIELGSEELSLWEILYNMSQVICRKLISIPERTNEVDRLIDKAEDLREALGIYTWGV